MQWGRSNYKDTQLEADTQGQVRGSMPFGMLRMAAVDSVTGYVDLPSPEQAEDKL